MKASYKLPRFESSCKNIGGLSGGKAHALSSGMDRVAFLTFFSTCFMGFKHPSRFHDPFTGREERKAVSSKRGVVGDKGQARTTQKIILKDCKPVEVQNTVEIISGISPGKLLADYLIQHFANPLTRDDDHE